MNKRKVTVLVGKSVKKGKKPSLDLSRVVAVQQAVQAANKKGTKIEIKIPAMRPLPQRPMAQPPWNDGPIRLGKKRGIKLPRQRPWKD